MKYLIFFLFPIFSYAQQDSVVYEKVGKVWFKVTYSTEQRPLAPRTSVVKDPYTEEDTLIQAILLRDILNKGRQYADWKERKDEEEKGYLLAIRQAEKQYMKLYGKKPDLDSLSQSKDLIGTWLLNNKEISITKQLKLEGQDVNFVSETTFWVILNGKREYFFKRKDSWVSDNYKLIPVKKKNK